MAAKEKINCPVCGTEVSECSVEQGVIVCPFCHEKIKSSPSPTDVSQKFPSEISKEYTVRCRICDTLIKYTDKQVGQTIVCKTCNEKIVLPSLAALTKCGNESKKITKNQKAQGYIIHVLDVLLQKGHRLLFCFLLFNAALAVFLMQWSLVLLVHSEAAALFIAIAIYLLSVMLMTSPVGEIYLRHSCGCKPFKKEEDINFFYPIFSNTLAAARRVDPNIPEDITFFINDDTNINAFATGRKTICVSRGLMRCTPRQIEAIIAHEFGHLSHKDTDITLFVHAGNIVIDIFSTIMNWIVITIKYILTVIGAILGRGMGSNGTNGQADAGGCLGFFLGGFIVYLWEKITLTYWIIYLFCKNRAGRQDEFHADEFSFNSGYGKDLCSAFEYMSKIYKADNDPGPQSFMMMLNSTHPSLSDRIAHLQEMGANYARDRKVNKII